MKFVVIGGDGSFRGLHQLIQEFPIQGIGVPGTIDNDLYGTDFTIGFDTAVNTALEAIDKIWDTASSHSRLFIIEVMGRTSGYIALYTGIGGGAEDILIPESPMQIPQLVSELEEQYKAGKKSSIIVIAEGETTGACPNRGVIRCVHRRILPDLTKAGFVGLEHEVEPNLLTAAVNEVDSLYDRGPLLVHCGAGIERSPLVVAVWMTVKFNISLDHAISLDKKSSTSSRV